MYWFYFPTWGGTDSRPWFWFLNLWSEHPWCCIRSKWWNGKCKLFFFLATLGLPCSAQAFPYLWHVDSWGLLHRGISSPPGIKPVSPALEGRVLSTGPPGKSLGNVNFGWAVLKLLSPGSPIEYYDNLSPHLYPLTYTAEWVHQIRSDYNLFQTSPLSSFQWRVFSRVLNFRLIYLHLLGWLGLLKCLTVIFFPCTIFEVSPFFFFLSVPPTACGILVPQPARDWTQVPCSGSEES